MTSSFQFIVKFSEGDVLTAFEFGSAFIDRYSFRFVRRIQGMAALKVGRQASRKSSERVRCSSFCTLFICFAMPGGSEMVRVSVVLMWVLLGITAHLDLTKSTELVKGSRVLR